MRKRRFEFTILALGLIAIVAVAVAGAMGGAVSAPSTFDGGPRGYEALFNVLRREALNVSQLRLPLGMLPREVRVLAVTRDGGTNELAETYDGHDLTRIERFVKRGGTFAAFLPASAKLPKAIASLPKTRVLRFDVTRYDNAALDAHPERAADVYAALAGRGPIAFDERIYGYDDTRSFWSVLPQAVRAACWLALAMLLIALVDANVPFVPPTPIDPPSDRDSSSYITSMAALLRRGRAGHAAIARFARTYPDDDVLARFAALRDPSDAVLVRAAQITASRRKDHA